MLFAFQELLGFCDAVLQALEEGNLYRPEWRESMVLLGGVLHRQGADKVDGLVSAALDNLNKRTRFSLENLFEHGLRWRSAALARQAQFASLFGPVVADLSPTGYQPSDPRYRAVLEEVRGIFRSSALPGD